jgi:hypothetical protein
MVAEGKAHAVTSPRAVAAIIVVFVDILRSCRFYPYGRFTGLIVDFYG